MLIRPVLPDDREELRHGLIALSPESRYYRFLNAGTGAVPSEALLDYLTRVDQKDHVALGIAVISPDLKTERGVGIARFIRLPDHPDVAEAAITVADDMQRRGVARTLLRELLRAARARGIKTLRADVVSENETMRSILERAGARPVENECGDGTITYDLSIATPTLHEEAHDETFFDILRGAAQTMAFRFRRDGWFVK